MIQKATRLKVDPEFAKLVKASAAISERSILKYTREVAKKNKETIKLPEGFINIDLEI